MSRDKAWDIAVVTGTPRSDPIPRPRPPGACVTTARTRLLPVQLAAETRVWTAAWFALAAGRRGTNKAWDEDTGTDERASQGEYRKGDEQTHFCTCKVQ